MTTDRIITETICSVGEKIVSSQIISISLEDEKIIKYVAVSSTFMGIGFDNMATHSQRNWPAWQVPVIAP
jgi:hypothetical protein